MYTSANFSIIGLVGKITPIDGGVKVSIASERPYKDKQGKWVENTKWNTVTIFREGTRNWIAENLQPGDLVTTNGEISDESYEKDGQPIYTTALVANEFNRLLKKAQFTQKKAGLPKQG